MGKQKSFSTFLAIPLPEENKQEIANFQEQLSRLNLPFTWELPEKLHITLHFFGRIDDSRTHQVKTSLENLLAEQPVFELQPTYIDYFYKKHEDSILFLIFKDSKPLIELEKQIRELLFELEFSPPQALSSPYHHCQTKKIASPQSGQRSALRSFRK